MGSSKEDQQYETIGRTICTIHYLFFALKFIAVASGIALVILFFLRKPLWLAPVIGIVIFWIYRSVRRMIFSAIIRASRKACERSEDAPGSHTDPH